MKIETQFNIVLEKLMYNVLFLEKVPGHLALNDFEKALAYREILESTRVIHYLKWNGEISSPRNWDTTQQIYDRVVEQVKAFLPVDYNEVKFEKHCPWNFYNDLGNEVWINEFLHKHRPYQ